MKIKIGAKDLQKRVDILSKIAKNKTTLPILDTFKMDVSDDMLTLTASDLEVTVITQVVPEEINQTGSVCVQADKFADIIGKSKDLMLELSLISRTVDGVTVNDLLVKSKGGKFKIPCCDSEDFPQIQEVQDATEVEINSNYLVTGIDKTRFCIVSNEFTPALNGVNIDMFTDKTIIAATDKNRMGLVYGEPISPVKQNVVLPLKLSAFIPTVFSDGNEALKLSVGSKNVRIEGINYTVYSKTIEFPYPNYEPLIPTNHDIRFVIDRAEFEQAVDRINGFCPFTTSAMLISLTDGKLSITGEDKDFNLAAEEEIECTNEGEGAFLINGKFLLEIIKRINTKTIEVSFSATNVIVLFKPTEDNKKDCLFIICKLAM
jgi:DNA polymerase-3 subunit beta